MAQDLRQAILALTTSCKNAAHDNSPPDMILVEEVLALMPAGPILETLWAGLPVPQGIAKIIEEERCPTIIVEYSNLDDLSRVYNILWHPGESHEAMIEAMHINEEAVAAKARIAREHALEKRLLAERDAFNETAPDNPLRLMMAEELNGALYCEYPTGLDISKHVDEAMARLRAASTAPIHIGPEGEEEADGPGSAGGGQLSEVL